MVKLVDTQDLGSCGFAVGVRVPSPAPKFLGYNTMQEIESNINGLTHEYKVIVDHQAINNALIVKLQDIGKRIRMPGFRPGHVPLPVLIKNYGDAVKDEAILDEVKRQAAAFVKEKGLKAALKPTVQIVENKGDGVVVKVTVDVLPEINLVDFGHPKIKKYHVTIEDEKIDELIADALEKSKKWVAKDSEASLVEGDKAVIDLELISDKKGKKKERPLKGISVILGNTDFVKEFWQNLIGMKAQEEKNFTVNYEKNSITYHAKVNEIFSPVDYVLDDEFAKSLGLDSKDKIRSWAAGVLENEFKEDINDLVKKQLLDIMSNIYNFDVPNSMVELEQKEMLRQLNVEAAKNNKRIISDKLPQLNENCRNIAIRRVRLGLVIAKIAADNGIVIAPDEIRKAIFSIAKMYPGRETEVIKRYVNDPEALAAISGPLLETKVVNFILDKYTDVETIEITTEEFKKIDASEFGEYKEDEFLEDIPEKKVVENSDE